MRANELFFSLSASILLAVLITTCAGSSQKAFDQMSAQEHRDAAAREHRLADESFAQATGENIEPPETIPGYGYVDGYGEYGGAVSYAYDPYLYELGDPETYVAWPRVSDPSEKHADAASEHRENALRHERAAAALEGRPSPQPLPPLDDET